MQLNLNQIILQPGHPLLLQDVSWEIYEKLQEELNENYAGVRLTYNKNKVEIVSPLFLHEDDKNIIADCIQILLEELDKEFRNAGSTTFKNKQRQVGTEPDVCFYIQHEKAVRGKARLDMSIDPPPDLVLEIDVTSKTKLDVYQALSVPEVWRFEDNQLKIYVLSETEYESTQISSQFPDFDVCKIIPEFLQKSKIEGRNATMRQFRAWVQQKGK